MTSAASNQESKFLAGVPPEIREVLDWYAAGAARGDAGTKLAEFAFKFLGWLIEDHAVIPRLAVSAPEVLALILLHHQRNPENPAAWLNLRLALRRMALHQADGEGSNNQRRLQCALESLERSLQLDPQNVGKNTRKPISHALRCVSPESAASRCATFGRETGQEGPVP